MLFEIRHVTEYVYDATVRESVMELWMQPRSGGGHHLVNAEIEIDPPAQLFSFADNWGNTVRYFDVPFPHQRLTITARSLVDADEAEPVPEALDVGEWERLRGEPVRADCWDFLRPHGFATPTRALRRFCRERGIDKLTSLDPLTALRRLNTILYQGLDYEPGVTAADSPIDEALIAGRGVCQDFAHIMIAICRGWGVPARYVSGYLGASRDEHERFNPEATHAWIEVFLPSLRWIGFDPTNDALAGPRHIPVAIGRDYSDVPPARGVFKGDAESRLSVGVSVRESTASLDERQYLQLSAPAIAAARRRASSAALLDQHHHQQQQQQQQSRR
ncbi:MAG TPA: transglutaminase family protein [Caulobacteraceae bacterium]|jgi:transglutaminase-like putative cysteine protease|nr:transglutaminase family protein [Caulobacteraceae bacterium]